MMKKLALFTFVLPTLLFSVVRRHDIPESRYIQMGSQARFDCVGAVFGNLRGTGVLIAPDLVLTAGHLFNEEISSSLFGYYDPVVGITNITGTAIRHPSYQTKYNETGGIISCFNDIAIIQLDQPIHNVQPAKINVQSCSLSTKIVCGCGRPGNGETGIDFEFPASSTLHRLAFVTTFIDSIDTFGDLYFISKFEHPLLSDQTLYGCAVEMDSGAPAGFINWDGDFHIQALFSIYGVDSLTKAATYGTINYYMPLFIHRDWLQQYLDYSLCSAY